MTTDEIRIAMAELEGIQTKGWWCQHCYQEVSPSSVCFDETHDDRSGGCGNRVTHMPIPDYPNDWNAVRRVVNAFSPADRLTFLGILSDISFRRSGEWFPARILTSTPDEWCESVLRVTGKWRG